MKKLVAKLKKWGARAAGRIRSLVPVARDKFRAWPLLAIFLGALALTAFLNPLKTALAVWGISKLGLGAYLGYWVDRLLFPYARPHELTGVEAGTSWKRRALLVAASIIAAALLP